MAAVVLGAASPRPRGGVTHGISYYGVEVNRAGGACDEEPNLAPTTGVLRGGMPALAQ